MPAPLRHRWALEAMVALVALGLGSSCRPAEAPEGGGDAAVPEVDSGQPDAGDVADGGSAGDAGRPEDGGPRWPFPQGLTYPNSIKPRVAQAALNQAVAQQFDTWKATYVRASNGTTPGGGWFVQMQGTGGTGTEKTTSEAHGYGMILFALMAGHDPQARAYFDGMFNMADHHRSTGDHDLMSWVIDTTELTSKDQDSATDGDLDIAYALLLADAQWGSDGGVDYLGQARRIITSGIKPSEMNTATGRTRLGDWDTDAWNTRSSDWMPDHFRAYRAATGDAFWDQATATAYDTVAKLRAAYAPGTGLMPDFAVGDPPRPAAPNFLEAATDGDYSWNACRVPLRLAVDYAHHGAAEAKTELDVLATWVEAKTAGDPARIKAGYSLDGGALETYSASAFTAPLVAACVCDPRHQDYLDRGWALLAAGGPEGYYEDTLRLLSMLLISGNWWAPPG